MGRFGRMANCLRDPQVEKVHPSYLMISQAPRIYLWWFAALVLFAGAFLADAQEKPDRPPWSQPSAPQPQPPPPSGQPQPSTAPGPMVLAPVQAPEKQKEPPTPRGTIKVNANLVHVLVSVLAERTRS